MPEHRKEPGPGHQALMADLKGCLKRFHDQGLPPVEQMAVLAQLLGQVVADIDTAQFETSDIMRSISGNIAAGNKVAMDARDRSSHGLAGFEGEKLQ